MAAGCIEVNCRSCLLQYENEVACSMRIVPSPQPHVPVFECSYMVFFCLNLLLMVPKSQWPPYAMDTIRRYVPYLKIYFKGIHDNIDNLVRRASE
jgi:hypothetical protein